MSIVNEPPLRETYANLVSAPDASLGGKLSPHEANSLIREAVTTFILLRWAEQAETELEVKSGSENRPYHPLLPRDLQWRYWARSGHTDLWTVSMQNLAACLEHGDADHGPSHASWLHRLAGPLRRIVLINPIYLFNLLGWVDELPLETPGNRRALLELFDLVLAETTDAHDGPFQTPANIAGLMAAIAQPRPGERVNDPCFGSGYTLVAAWQEAERISQATHQAGAALDVTGREINESAFLTGLTRMLLAGIDNPHLELGNSLEREVPISRGHHGFDLVLADPPIGAKVLHNTHWHQHFAFITNDSLSLFIQHVMALLKPEGRAVLAVPEGFLSRSGIDCELRRHLLIQGQVEAVIGLPAGAFAPYTNIKGALLVLRRMRGDNCVRMVDASPLFSVHRGAGASRKALVISPDIARQLATALRHHDLRQPAELTQGLLDKIPGTDLLPIETWEVSLTELEEYDWDLTPRRRINGSYMKLRASIKEALDDTGSVESLSTVAQIMVGRSIKTDDLLDEPQLKQEADYQRAIGYVRLNDLNQGRVRRPSRWLRPAKTDTEGRWALLAGDILVSKSGTIGKTAIVRKDTARAIAGNGLYVLRSDQKRLDPAFLEAYLASPACQDWLAARSSGTTIQHLKRELLELLPVPLPPLPLQARAAAQYRDQGTDILSFLTQVTGRGKSDRLALWLSELRSKLPLDGARQDGTLSLSAMEGLAAMAATPRQWLRHEEIGEDIRWLMPLVDTLEQLAGVAQIPLGPGLLSVLQDAERTVQTIFVWTIGHRPVQSQAHAVAEQIRNWVRALIEELVNKVDLRVSQAPKHLVAGTFAEFSLVVENAGILPLRAVVLETAPDWGTFITPYLAERATVALALRGEVPKESEQLTLNLHWRGRTLDGSDVRGSMEFGIRIFSSSPEAVEDAHADLGGSPYVTGSPLAPQHGHSVFFGREDLIEQVSRQIRTHGNVVLLEGNRRTGKTSILKHLEGRSAIPGWMAVYASLQGAEGSSQAVGVPTADVFREIARSIAAAITKLDIDVALPNGQVIAAGKPGLGIARACREGISYKSPFVDFRDYLEVILGRLNSLGLGLLLMLDEFDKLQEGIDSGMTSPQVPENIRFLMQNYPMFSCILTGSRRLKRLREEYWSALYGLGTSIPVTGLDVESARRVVTEPVRDRLTFSTEAVERIIQVTARQPYLIQCLCNRIFTFTSYAKTRSITLSVVDDAASTLVRDNEHFASLWDYAARGPRTGGCRRQLILLLCALSYKRSDHMSFGTLRENLLQDGVVVDDAALDADLADLRELELVEFAGEIGYGHYGLAIPLMAQWIEQHQDADLVISRAHAEAEEEYG